MALHQVFWSGPHPELGLSTSERTLSRFPWTPPVLPPYQHTPLFPLGKEGTSYRKLGSAGLRVEKILARGMLVVEREALRALAEAID